jgi:phosphoglycerate kinase
MTNRSGLEILRLAKEKVQIHIPVDVVAANAFSNDAETKIVDVNEIPDGWQRSLDAGPKSLATSKSNDGIKTILWNGPLGVFEMENLLMVLSNWVKYIAASLQKVPSLLWVVVTLYKAVKQFGLEDKMSYVSTGGGAMANA